MPNNKVSEAQAIYIGEIRRVQNTAEKWRDFLDFAAQAQISENQNEFEFSSKLIIHAENPNAADCRTFGEWKTADKISERLENADNQGEKGIINTVVATSVESGSEAISEVVAEQEEKVKPSIEHERIPEEREPDIAEDTEQKIINAVAAVTGIAVSELNRLPLDI